MIKLYDSLLQKTVNMVKAASVKAYRRIPSVSFQRIRITGDLESHSVLKLKP